MVARTRVAIFDWGRVGEDSPNTAVIELAHIVLESDMLEILVTSGRKEQCRAQTAAWLAGHGVFYREMFMRADRDDRDDEIVKREIYLENIAPFYDVRFVVDDRQRVVDMWRSLGLTCLQVADGRF